MVNDIWYFEFKREHVKAEVYFAYSPRITACVIHAIHRNSKKKWDYLAEGVSKVHPKDKYDEAKGRHIAFKRAFSALAVLYWKKTGRYVNMSLESVYNALRHDYSHEYWEHFKSIESKEKSNGNNKINREKFTFTSEILNGISRQRERSGLPPTTD